MNKIIYFIFLFIYILFIDYLTKMSLYDYRKYIKKDEIMNNIKFCWNWQEKYAEAKALEKFEQMHTPEDIKN